MSDETFNEYFDSWFKDNKAYLTDEYATNIANDEFMKWVKEQFNEEMGND